MLYLWQSNRFIYLDSIFNSKYFGDLAFTFQTTDKGRISRTCMNVKWSLYKIYPICGQHFEFNEMEGDRIKPWSKGGQTSLENCQMLCKDCNGKKTDKY